MKLSKIIFPIGILFIVYSCSSSNGKKNEQLPAQTKRENYDSLMVEYCKETSSSLFGKDSSVFVNEMKRISAMKYPPDMIMTDYHFMYEIFSSYIYDHEPSLRKYLDSADIPEYRTTIACLLLYIDTVATYEYKLGFMANTMLYYYEKNNRKGGLLMEILYEGLRYTNEGWEGFSIRYLNITEIVNCQKYVHGLVKLIQSDYLADHGNIDEAIKMKEELIKDGFLSEYNKFRIKKIKDHK